MKYSILIVDDDNNFANRLSEALSAEDRNFFVADSAESAKEILQKNDLHLVLLDERLPDMSGTHLLEYINTNFSDLITVFITATNDIPVVVKAIQAGAYHYIVKPFKIQELDNTVKNALEKVELRNKIKDLENRKYTLDTPVFSGKSAQIKEILNQIHDIKGHAFTSLLITGETGTGKGSLAKHIHLQYSEDFSDFIHISCADIPANLLETEIFGYEKGAFTDAKNLKKGLFEIAHGGTLFLDEIDSIPSELQSKLLYFLDNKKIRRVGGTQEITVDTRLIVATNNSLVKLVNEGLFRKDLFYRLNVFHVDMPPLRERPDEILFFANYFRELFNVTFNKSVIGFTQNVIEKLQTYPWPGNIRELKNVIERSVLFEKNNKIEDITLIQAEDNVEISNSFIFPSNKNTIIPIEKLEVKYIKHALKLFDENRTHTAKALGISIPTLLSKIKKN